MTWYMGWASGLPPNRSARPRVIRGTRAAPLPLLPSGPGGVCGRPLHGARDLTSIHRNMRCFAHVLEQNLHIALRCAVVEHASTERELPPDHGVGEVAAPRPLQLEKDPLIQLVQITGVAARRVAKTENRKTSGQHLTIVAGFHQPPD